MNDFFRPIASDMDRLKSIKKHRIGRRSKQLEKYEQKMKEERQKRFRERQKEFFSEIEIHKYVLCYCITSCIYACPSIPSLAIYISINLYLFLFIYSLYLYAFSLFVLSLKILFVKFRERLEDVFKMRRERWKGFNRSVREFHKRKERIHREKIDRIQREKINLLKINDVEGYLRMVQVLFLCQVILIYLIKCSVNFTLVF